VTVKGMKGTRKKEMKKEKCATIKHDWITVVLLGCLCSSVVRFLIITVHKCSYKESTSQFREIPSGAAGNCVFPEHA